MYNMVLCEMPYLPVNIQNKIHWIDAVLYTGSKTYFVLTGRFFGVRCDQYAQLFFYAEDQSITINLLLGIIFIINPLSIINSVNWFGICREML